jgi:hypothetical protein
VRDEASDKNTYTNTKWGKREREKGKQGKAREKGKASERKG